MSGLVFTKSDPDNPVPVRKVVDSGGETVQVYTDFGDVRYIPKSDIKRIERAPVVNIPPKK